MDDKKCVRSTFAYMPSEIRGDSCIENKRISKKGKHRASNDIKCPGDILYLQNPLFQNVPLNSRDNSKNCKVFSKNLPPYNISENYFHRLFSPTFNLQNTQIVCESNKKSRKDGMKARAKTRRDILISESSDDDYSPINSRKDFKSLNKSHRNSSNMDDAYNRRSRSARTERYFRRLSREDNFQDYEPGATNCRIGAPARNQDVRYSSLKYEPQSFAKPAKKSPDSLFLNQDNAFLSNPIYRTSGNNPPIFQDKHSRRETIENEIYSGNIDLNKTRRSDPGSSAILAYKKKNSPPVFDRSQYIERQILNYEEPRQSYQQNKPSINPKKIVRRSYSFQNEIPREYETRNDFSTLTMRRFPSTRVSESGNNNSRNECKGIDTIPSRTPDGNVGDFQWRRVYPWKERSEFKAGDRNSTSIVTEDNISAVKKRNSKDLGKELSELEKMYTSLRLSDDNLLERAEERCAEELSLKSQSQSSTTETFSNRKYLSSGSSSESIPGENNLPGEKYSQQSSDAHVKNDDMAYRKMQPKKMPALSETQNSLSQISYLLASSALILGEKIDFPIELETKVSKEEPNITKDDMVYRNLSYANNVLRVIEPQPPFGIPLRPATPSTNSNYLCSSPVVVKSPPLKFVPQSEPNLVTDDLAFRNLRKDAPKSPSGFNEDNGRDASPFSFSKTDLDESLNDEKFFRKKKKAVRSLSANLYGLIKEVNHLELNIK